MSGEALSTGWEPDVPVTDTIVRRYLLDWAELNVRLAAPRDGVYRDDLVVIADCSAPNAFLNTVMLMHPRAAMDPGPVMVRVREVFDRREGGPYTVVSPWPTGDLRAEGLSLMGHPPLMLRPAGGAPPPLPDGLEIRRVGSPDELRAFEDVECRAWGEEESRYPDLILSEPDWTMWLGLLDGAPVATAAASLGNGITRVEWIASVPEVRGRGIGAAMTWTATLVDPSRDAVLISSDLGRGVYEGMGYRALDRFTLWSGTRDGSR